MTSLDEPKPDGTNDIYHIVIECMTLFESLSEQVTLDHGEKDIKVEKGEQEDGQMASGDQISGSKLSTNEMKRSFNLWIDNTDALAADVSESLDTRLYAHRDIKRWSLTYSRCSLGISKIVSLHPQCSYIYI